MSQTNWMSVWTENSYLCMSRKKITKCWNVTRVLTRSPVTRQAEDKEALSGWAETACPGCALRACDGGLIGDRFSPCSLPWAEWWMLAGSRKVCLTPSSSRHASYWAFLCRLLGALFVYRRDWKNNFQGSPANYDILKVEKNIQK